MEQPGIKKRIITIAGPPGSGKSTTSRTIASDFGYEHFSSGDLFRALGGERGLDVTRTNLAAEQETKEEKVSVDHLVDQRLRDIGATQQEVVIDSRTAWHWIPDSFKVFLSLDLEVAARRILANIEPARLESEHIPTDPKEYAAALQERLDSEVRRYKKKYGINPYDHSNYDLVIDTGNTPPNEVIARVATAYQEWLSH